MHVKTYNPPGHAMALENNLVANIALAAIDDGASA
jgi:hypothetical protein